MNTEDVINKLNTNCSVYYGKNCISLEPIVDDYLHFLAKGYDSASKKVCFSLNTGSLVFDIIAVVTAVISSLAYNRNTNDDIISSLQPGDMVLYRNKRYIWDGFKEENGEVYMVLKTTDQAFLYTSFERNKSLVKKYSGNSRTTDGRGIRKKKNNREEFFSFIYGIPVAEVPSAIDASFVVVADRGFGDVLREVSIKFDEKKVSLLDLVACSYYTSGLEELAVGSNPSKKEPVIKLTSQISTGRELALKSNGNSVAGIIVTCSSETAGDNSELLDLIGRRKIRYLHYLARYDTALGEQMVKEFPDASVFACTPSYLKEVNLAGENSGPLSEVERQISNLANLTITETVVESAFSFEKVRFIKNAVFDVKESYMDEDAKNDFVLHSLTLLKLYLTAPFKLRTMEKCISESKLRMGVCSPGKRIEELKHIASQISGMDGIPVNEVVQCLDEGYRMLLDTNPKENALERILKDNRRKRIAVIVPKAYYGDVLRNSSVYGVNSSNVMIETTKSFDPSCFYDVIIAVGDLDTDRFRVFECFSADKIHILLGGFEKRRFSLKCKKAEAYEKNILGKHREHTYRIDEKSEREVISQVQDIEVEEVDEGIYELTDYLDGLKYTVPSRYLAGNAAGESGNACSEVSYVGCFESGERIFFSRYYSAVVFDTRKGVTEKNAEKLQPGDRIVFTKNDSYTKNIVDYVFDELLNRGKLSKGIDEAFSRTERWKAILREYKENNGYSYRELTGKLNDLGLGYGEVAVRQWLIPESHLVGPRKAEVISIIGKLVDDKDMSENYSAYEDAFSLVRKQRRGILELISRAINDKLSGRHNSKDEVIQIIYDNVDRLSEIYDLESIHELEETIYVPVGYVNRPIDSEDIGL